MSTTADFDNIVQISNGKTLSISSVKYDNVPSIKNVGTANDIKLEITLPPSNNDLEVEIGNIETGDTPSVKKRLSGGKMYLDFVLPTKGDKGTAGSQGNAATIEIGKVSIGNVAKVENTGTKTNAILNFTLPYSSGQGSYVKNDNGDVGFGGDEETAEELKNVADGINRSAKATEELEVTITDILSQVTLMAQQNKVIISRVVNQAEQLSKTLGDRIDANKMAIKAVQMTAIDKSMLDDAKDRISNCEQTVALLRGELGQIFMSEIYRGDRDGLINKIEKIQESINTINSVLGKVSRINETITQLDANSVQDRMDIDLLQTKVSELSVDVAGKWDSGQLVTSNDLDAGLKNSIDSIDGIRTTTNQNAGKISDISDTVNNLLVSMQSANQAITDIQAAYVEGDKTNKSIIDALSATVTNQNTAINETIAEIQEAQSAADEKYVHADKTYTKTEVNDLLNNFVSKSGDNIVGNFDINGYVTALSFNGRLVGNADSATVADSATNDSEGHNIADTYVTKSERDELSARLEDANNQAAQTEQKLTELTDRVNNEVSSNTMEIASLKESYDALTSNLDSISGGKISETDIESLRNIISADIEELRNTINTDRENLQNSINAEKESLQNSINADIESLQNSIDADREELRSTIDAYKKDLQDTIDVDREDVRSIIDSDREDNDAKHREFEEELSKFMLKSDVISKDQLEDDIAEKLNSNTEAISLLNESQIATDNKVEKNTDSISELRTVLSETTIFVPEKVTLEAIEAMFEEYMPEEPEPEPEPSPEDEPEHGEDNEEENSEEEQHTPEEENPSGEESDLEEEPTPTEEPSEEEPTPEENSEQNTSGESSTEEQNTPEEENTSGEEPEPGSEQPSEPSESQQAGSEENAGSEEETGNTEETEGDEGA